MVFYFYIYKEMYRILNNIPSESELLLSLLKIGRGLGLGTNGVKNLGFFGTAGGETGDNGMSGGDGRAGGESGSRSCRVVGFNKLLIIEILG